MKLSGIVYMMDDDNKYNPKLFPHLRTVKPNRVAIFAVRRWMWKGIHLIEMPQYDRGHFVRFQAGWCHGSWLSKKYGNRHFCIDMGGFAFDAHLLHGVRGSPWNVSTFRNPHGGENEFLSLLMGESYDLNLLQTLVDCGSTVYVFHNEYMRTGENELIKVCPCDHNSACTLKTNCTTTCNLGNKQISFENMRSKNRKTPKRLKHRMKKFIS
jgi:hypothetical protein